MQVKECMTQGAQCVAPDTTLREAAQRMRDGDIGFLPVCEKDRVTGTVTDRDITIRAVAEGRPGDETRVREVMTKDVVYCFDDEDPAQVAKKMEDRQIRRILVMNRQKRLVGVCSIGDLATEKTRPLAEEVLEKVCH